MTILMGGSPHFVAEWILTSQVWVEHSIMEKRTRQLVFIFNNKVVRSSVCMVLFWYKPSPNHN